MVASSLAGPPEGCAKGGRPGRLATPAHAGEMRVPSGGSWESGVSVRTVM